MTWRLLIALVVIFLAPVVLMFLQRMRMRVDFDYAMRIMGARAVNSARLEYQVILDYSLESVQEVEDKILAKLHESHLKTPMDERELALASLRWGSYIGEVLKRTKRGRWQRDSQVGRGTTPVVFKDGTEAFPRSWVYKRIADGPDDNVVFKVRVLTDPELERHLHKVPTENPS